MKNVLLLNGLFFPSASSNGICANELIKELNKRGIQTYMITDWQCETGQHFLYESTEVFCIKQAYYIRLKQRLINMKGFCKFIYSLLEQVIKYNTKLLSFFSYYVPAGRVKAYIHTARRLIEDKKIDTIISVNRPPETILAGLKLKKIFPKIYTIAYLLDLLQDVSPKNKLKKKIYDKNVNLLYISLLKKYDKILSAENTISFFSQDMFLPYMNKVNFFGFPLFHSPFCSNIDKSEDFEKGKINVVFTGNLSEFIRTPEGILTFMVPVIKNIPKCVLHFYSKGCENILNKFKKQLGDNLILHGFVPYEEALIAMQNADILLNISNKIATQVPSKIFEYFSYCKPILNYRYIKEDPSNVYYKKYPLICNIDEYDDTNCEEIIQFVSGSYHKHLDYEEVRKTYISNTPAYNIDLLLKNKEKNHEVTSDHNSSSDRGNCGAAR